MKSSAKLVPIKIIAIYSVLLYGAWSVYHFFILSHIENIPNELLSSLLNDGVCKNLIWTLPAWILMGKYSDSLKISRSELLKFDKKSAKYLLIAPAFALYIAAGLLIHKQPIGFSLTISEIITVLFVGVTEEAVFRGWLLNSTINYAREPESEDDIPYGQYGAIAINALMFLVIHFPRWIGEGVFVSNFASMGFVSIIALSLIFSLTFLKTRNIIVPVVLHMAWDLLIFLMY